MLGESTVTATIAVRDIAAGKAFYGDKLGLTQVDENPGGVMYQSGEGKLFIYQSETAGKGQATCVTWGVDDLNVTVDTLKGHGIAFDHYDIPDTTWEGDIAIMGPMKSAWFKDPDGNILNVNQH